MYILQIQNRSYVKILEDEFLITPNIEISTKYDKIGDAMRAAILVNEILGFNNTYVVKYNKQ